LSKEAPQSLPAGFVSHGAPTLAVDENDTTEFLKQLGRELGKPKAVLCVSAHWNTSAPAVSAAKSPRTIHDFGGFAEELYRINYPAPGAPALATRVVGLLGDAGIDCSISPGRGLDHGAWVPLRKITEGKLDELLNYRTLAPHARLAHPIDEHLLPLFVGLGAGSGGEGVRVGRALHRGWTVGSLSMAAYGFGSVV
jgi:aromatic ring-opening dioxygenase catalytic subunit (LigB family)